MTQPREVLVVHATKTSCSLMPLPLDTSTNTSVYTRLNFDWVAAKDLKRKVLH